MTIRDEEIKQHATDISNTWLSQDYQQVAYDAAIKMAEWADQYPREGLWDSEKVCSFIEENIDNYLYINRDWNAPQIKSNFIEDLRKAMEG